MKITKMPTQNGKPMNNTFQLNIGKKVLYDNKECTIKRLIDINRISIEENDSGIVHTVRFNEIVPIYNNLVIRKERNIIEFTDEEWKKAQERFAIIKPIIENRGDLELVKKMAKQGSVNKSSVYRWVGWYESTGNISSLLGQKKNGGRGKSRLTSEQEEIVQSNIKEVYLTSFRKSMKYLIRAIHHECKEKQIPFPHEATIRRRVNEISEEEKIRARYGKKRSDNKFAPIRGEFPHANYPLSVVQIDHTPVDIILVDEIFRQPFNRPYLTVAIDVYSRMILGIHLSFDPPGAMGTGLCISNAILPKEIYLEKLGIEGTWGCWGVMDTIHMDNAKEFRGNMLKKASENYGINLEFRPVATPHYGGHIERFLGSFAKSIHDLPGTTFSNKDERSNYKSEKHASLTLGELETWMITYIINVYHKSLHSGIGTSPEEKYIEGIFGNEEQKGIGLPSRIFNERKVRLDFMPYFERSIQQYGVVIDHITYYDEVFRKYIHVPNKKKSSQKYSFRRNPKDISVIYFFDPETGEYYDVSYRDTRYPPISIWEFRAVLKKLKENNSKNIDEELIFDTYKKLEEIELRAIKTTKKLNKTSRRILTKGFNHKENLLFDVSKLNPNIKTISLEENEHNQKQTGIPIHLKPFENLDDEAFDD